MNKNLLIILIFVSLFSNMTFSQTENSYKKTSIKTGYFGEFVLHPGLYAGIEYTVHQNSWFNLHWDSEMGMYTHKWNNNSMFAQTSIGTRFISPFTAFIDFNLGFGYMLSSPSGDVYSVDSDNILSTKGRPFTSHLKPNLSLLFGWDGTKKSELPVVVSLGIEAYWQTHFNHSILPHAALRLGVTYKLKNT